MARINSFAPIEPATRFYPREEILAPSPDPARRPGHPGGPNQTVEDRLTGEYLEVQEGDSEYISLDLMDEHIKNMANSKEVQATIRMAMDGTLPLDRPLKEWQPQKLNGRSIQVVVLKIVGYQNNKIGEMTGYSPSVISNVLNHPYSRRIMSVALAHSLAGASSVHKRLRRKAPQMLRVVEKIASDSTVKPAIRVRAAFGWLDRAGYSTVHKSEEKKEVKHSVQVDQESAQLLTTAIKEAQEAEKKREIVQEAKVVEPLAAEG